MDITSVNNEQVKDAVRLQQKKYRDSEDKFLLEGFKAIQEAFYAGLKIEKVFVIFGRESSYSFLKDKIILTTEAVVEKISTTESAPDAVAVAYKKHYSNNILKAAKKVVLLENVKDLGNLGTILRTSAAFGVDAVILYGDCADIYNPKCVRASVGNLWKIPVYNFKNIDDLKFFEDFQRIATLPRAENFLRDLKTSKKCLVMFGSEAYGLSDELIKFSTEHVKIEMKSNVESLNLSVSCAIVLYKIFI